MMRIERLARAQGQRRLAPGLGHAARSALLPARSTSISAKALKIASI
jgi:hypothetical protein